MPYMHLPTLEGTACEIGLGFRSSALEIMHVPKVDTAF